MKLLVFFALLSSLCFGWEDDKAKFTRDGDLKTALNYREWIFLSSGLGMTYGPNAPAVGAPLRFDNVFVNPSSYREFVRTGKWVDGTIMILEIRESQSKGSINQHGNFQTGVAAMEAHVKDSKRFKSGWAFYDLSAMKDSAKAIAPGNRCEQCHEANGSVDTTFVQFYPDLIPVAKKFGQWKDAPGAATRPATSAP
jgi:Cytochrome P460